MKKKSLHELMSSAYSNDGSETEWDKFPTQERIFKRINKLAITFDMDAWLSKLDKLTVIPDGKTTLLQYLTEYKEEYYDYLMGDK